MGSKRTQDERDAYATGCAIAGRLTEQHPDLADDLRGLIDASRTEQRLACDRGRPIYTDAERLVVGAETYLVLNRPAGTPAPDGWWDLTPPSPDAD
jgi:hypothetical protein